MISESSTGWDPNARLCGENCIPNIGDGLRCGSKADKPLGGCCATIDCMNGSLPWRCMGGVEDPETWLPLE